VSRTRLIVRDPSGRDVSDEIELKNGRASLFWSQYEVHHGGKRVGWLESGCPSDFVDGYTAEERPEPSS
jgi:hypothetical protein